MSFPDSHLPPMVKAFCTELATAYKCPIELPAMACLSVASAAIGNLARVCSVPGAEQYGANLFIAIGVEDQVVAGHVISQVTAPLVSKQRELVQEYEKMDPKVMREQLVNFQRKRTWVLVNRGDVPSLPDVLRDLDYQVCPLKLRSAPFYLLQDPDLSNIQPAFERSFDHSILAVFQDLGGITRLSKSSKQNAERIRILKQTWRPDLTAIGNSNDGNKTSPSESAISILGLGTPSELINLVNCSEFVESGVAERILAFDAGLKPVPLSNKLLSEIPSQRSWNNLVGSLFGDRQSLQTVEFKFTPDAMKCLLVCHNKFHDYVHTKNHPGEIDIGIAVIQCTKLALAIHLLGESGKSVIEQKSVLSAYMIYLWLLQRRAELRARVELKQQENKEEAACHAMLKKIASHERIPRRKLFRSYACQRYSIHQPVLDRLVATGRVAYDPAGNIMVLNQEVVGAARKEPAKETSAVSGEHPAATADQSMSA